MRIYSPLDLRVTANKTPTGVGNMFFQMVRGLSRIPGVRLDILATHDQLDGQGRIHAGNLLNDLPAVAVPLSNKTARALWAYLGRPRVDRWCAGADWVYTPYELYVPVHKARTAATIHGACYFERHLPQYHHLPYRLGRRRFAALYRRLARRADLLLVVSEYLKIQMVEWFGADPAKVVVIGNGVEECYFRMADQPPGSSGRGQERPFVLCVGGLNDMDGAQYILPVARVLAELAPDVQVLIAGNQHQPMYWEQAHALPNVVLLGYVQAAELAKLMHDSTALLFLSAWESFGIAAVEAMAAGTPVIASRITAVPETVGGAGLYVHVYEPREIARLIVDLAGHGPLRSDFVALGRRRAGQFTWQACLSRLVEALRAAS